MVPSKLKKTLSPFSTMSDLDMRPPPNAIRTGGLPPDPLRERDFSLKWLYRMQLYKFLYHILPSPDSLIPHEKFLDPPLCNRLHKTVLEPSKNAETWILKLQPSLFSAVVN